MTNVTGITALRPRATARPTTLPRVEPLVARRAQETGFERIARPRRASGGRMPARERFELLERRFIASKAKGVDLRMQYVLSGRGGGTWYVVIKDGKIKVTEGTGPSPHATWRSSAETYEKLDDGDMNATLAFLRGKVKVDGDEGKARLYGKLFRDLDDVT